MENFCAVIVESQNINYCYHAGSTRSLQVVKPENNKYGIDLKRAGGPDAIWKNKEGMKKNWRNNFVNLLNFMSEQ